LLEAGREEKVRKKEKKEEKALLSVTRSGSVWSTGRIVWPKEWHVGQQDISRELSLDLFIKCLVLLGPWSIRRW